MRYWIGAGLVAVALVALLLLGLGQLGDGASRAPAPDREASPGVPDDGGPAPDPVPPSVTAIPPTIESILTVDFGQEGRCPWLSAIRPRPERVGAWGDIPGLPEDVLRALAEADIDRLTIGARGFGPGTRRRDAGHKEEVRLFEVPEGLSSLVSRLEEEVRDGGAREEEAPFGRLFRFDPEGDRTAWMGFGRERICLITSEEDLARGSLARCGEAETGRIPEPVLKAVAGATTWREPLLILRAYDPENRSDIYSPLRSPRDDVTPQTRPFRVVGIRVGSEEGEELTAHLDVLTEEPEQARRYYHELLGFESRLEEPAPPTRGWIRFRLRSRGGEEAKFWLRLLLLFGYQYR